MDLDDRDRILLNSPAVSYFVTGSLLYWPNRKRLFIGAIWEARCCSGQSLANFVFSYRAILVLYNVATTDHQSLPDLGVGQPLLSKEFNVMRICEIHKEKIMGARTFADSLH